jgi:hypothetical protein
MITDNKEKSIIYVYNRRSIRRANLFSLYFIVQSWSCCLSSVLIKIFHVFRIVNVMTLTCQNRKYSFRQLPSPEQLFQIRHRHIWLQ